MEKPRNSIAMAEPRIDTGIVTMGTSDNRAEPRNRKITAVTSATASTKTRMTSFSVVWMNSASSDVIFSVMPSGREGRISSSSRWTACEIATVLACACGWIPIPSAVSPLDRK